MMKKIGLCVSMLAVLFAGSFTLTSAGACEDACWSTYYFERGRCYDYPAGWLRNACLVAVANQRDNCLAQCN